jgi:3-deoxy-D-arabino-heptulosonate 7-phosphate (DAHP) synthase
MIAVHNDAEPDLSDGERALSSDRFDVLAIQGRINIAA